MDGAGVRIATFWKTGSPEWTHEISPSSAILQEREASGWTHTRTISVPLQPDLEARTSEGNDADLLRFSGVDRQTKLHGRRLREAMPRERWEVFKAHRDVLGRLAADDLVRLILADPSIYPSPGLRGPRRLASRLLAVEADHYRNVGNEIIDDEDYEWKAMVREISAHGLLEQFVLAYRHRWASLGGMISYLRERPAGTVRIVYGWEPALVEIENADRKVICRYFTMGLQSLIDAEFLVLAGDSAPDQLTGIRVSDRTRDAETRAFVVEASGAGK